MAAENPAGLISTSAVQSGGKSYLFYSRPNGELAFLRSVVSSESSSNSPTVPLYTTGNIIVEENVVVANTKSPQIAAVAYSLNGQDEIRVYYVSSQGWLSELCKTGSGSWTNGSLNNSNYEASPKSLLTASVDNYGQGQLKLYYNRDNDSMMWVNFVTMGTQAWSRRKINDKY